MMYSRQGDSLGNGSLISRLLDLNHDQGVSIQKGGSQVVFKFKDGTSQRYELSVGLTPENADKLAAKVAERYAPNVDARPKKTIAKNVAYILQQHGAREVSSLRPIEAVSSAPLEAPLDLVALSMPSAVPAREVVQIPDSEVKKINVLGELSKIGMKLVNLVEKVCSSVGQMKDSVVDSGKSFIQSTELSHSMRAKMTAPLMLFITFFPSISGSQAPSSLPQLTPLPGVGDNLVRHPVTGVLTPVDEIDKQISDKSEKPKSTPALVNKSKTVTPVAVAPSSKKAVIVTEPKIVAPVAVAPSSKKAVVTEPKIVAPVAVAPVQKKAEILGTEVIPAIGMKNISHNQLRIFAFNASGGNYERNIPAAINFAKKHLGIEFKDLIKNPNAIKLLPESLVKYIEAVNDLPKNNKKGKDAAIKITAGFLNIKVREPVLKQFTQPAITSPVAGKPVENVSSLIGSTSFEPMSLVPMEAGAVSAAVSSKYVVNAVAPRINQLLIDPKILDESVSQDTNLNQDITATGYDLTRLYLRLTGCNHKGDSTDAAYSLIRDMTVMTNEKGEILTVDQENKRIREFFANPKYNFDVPEELAELITVMKSGVVGTTALRAKAEKLGIELDWSKYDEIKEKTRVAKTPREETVATVIRGFRKKA